MHAGHLGRGRRAKRDPRPLALLSTAVALLDINMPGGDGFEVAKRIDRIAPGGMVRKVFITASKDPTLRQKAIDSGAAFVEKPFTAEVLLEAIRNAFHEKPPALFE